jgi:UDP-N-acetylmuramoylalanine--D-glutamate ligase
VIFKSSVKIVNKNDVKTGEIFAKEKVVFFNGEKLCETGDLSLKGEHNLSNANAVLTCLKELKFDLTDAKKHLATFEPLPHRLQEVGERGGLTFIDDSISTTPETAIAALKVFEGREVTLLVGGFERQQNYAELCKYIKEHKVRAVTLPSTGARIYKELTALRAMSAAAKNMQEAVEIAKEITPKGGVILLSPAAPSYDFYKNFEERGKVFKSCI